MHSEFRVFDFHRIFLGDATPLFLLEIVFRTLIMYSYTVALLRILGKRGMGQLSMLELAIIISFGSAVGDPMVGADIPITHGVVAITVITMFQIYLERFINKNRKVEAIMEGSPNLIVNEGVINWDCMKKDNLSKEDLFRALRSKDVEHLGQVKKAFFETSGAVSVFFQHPRKVKPGLAVLPEELLSDKDIINGSEKVNKKAVYACVECGFCKPIQVNELPGQCGICHKERWTDVYGDD